MRRLYFLLVEGSDSELLPPFIPAKDLKVRKSLALSQEDVMNPEKVHAFIDNALQTLEQSIGVFCFDNLEKEHNEQITSRLSKIRAVSK